MNEILTRLETLNAKLQSELASSRQNLRLLEEELTKLKADLAELQNTLARSEEESTQLQDLLQKAESSLKQLEVSFAEYKSAAESRIRSLRWQRNLAILGIILVAFL